MIIEIHKIIIKACRRQATNRQPYRWQEKNINDEILQNSCILYIKNSLWLLIYSEPEKDSFCFRKR